MDPAGVLNMVAAYGPWGVAVGLLLVRQKIGHMLDVIRGLRDMLGDHETRLRELERGELKWKDCGKC